MQTNIFNLFLSAGWVAKAILLLLFLGSVMSWGIIFFKWLQFRSIFQQDRDFLFVFAADKELSEVLQLSTAFPSSGLAGCFRAAMREMKKSHFLSAPLQKENLERLLKKESLLKVNYFEKYSTFLASIASSAPFIGLFGTVWGIMEAFQSLGSAQTASLSVVAPGISEALITTAMGIATAIPPVLAYNYFTRKVDQLTTSLEAFSQDLLNELQKAFWKNNA